MESGGSQEKAADMRFWGSAPATSGFGGRSPLLDAEEVRSSSAHRGIRQVWYRTTRVRAAEAICISHEVCPRRSSRTAWRVHLDMGAVAWRIHVRERRLTRPLEMDPVGLDRIGLIIASAAEAGARTRRRRAAVSTIDARMAPGTTQVRLVLKQTRFHRDILRGGLVYGSCCSPEIDQRQLHLADAPR